MRWGIVFLVCGAVVAEAFAFELKSDAFENGGYIPAVHTCDSLDVSPPLTWDGVPEQTESFVLICDDPDAPFGIWVHWVFCNIPGAWTRCDENIPQQAMLPGGVVQGINDFGRVGYNGPCPPHGNPHRYFFKLYALDTTLVCGTAVKRKDVVEAMKGHILAETKLIGLYQR